jgi:drug/metabolite transporter (DMT)-like permease
MIKDLTLTNRLLLRKLKQWQWWFLVALNIFFLAVGQSAVFLIGRFYYVQGGNGKWMATLVQTAGFPILFIPLFLTPSSQQPSTSLALPSIKIHALIYFSLGVLISGDNMMYSVGLLYLPASTYSLICVSQLAFNAVFSYFINSQKFTASIVNSLVVLSLSAALIAVNEDSEGPSGVSRWKYITCLLCTLGASALSSLLLSLMQLSFQKVLKRETFSVVLEMQIYTSLVATCVSIVGLFASGEWRSLHGEMEGFGAGRVSYVMTLVWTAVAWQICSVGVVGLIFMVSSLFSNVISTSSLAVTPIATMIVFHDKMNGVKVIAMLLAIWGFASYIRRKQKDVSTTNIQQKGSIPSPQTPLLMMHKAEKKYEVGKVADEEEAKQRPIRAILNKLTPTNFEKLIEQMKAINIDNAATLTSFVSQIFDRALMEPIYCEMYVNFCCHLARELPDFNEDNEKVTFKRVLLNKCQEEFERGEREQEEANKAEEEGEIKQSAEQREEKRVKARRRMLGNIRLIGELYKKKVLTERIMHACIQKLLGQYQDPDEEDVEALCKLMSTTGEMIDHQKAKEHMDAYFDRMKALSNNMNLSSRVRFMLKDANDLRKNKWQQRRKVDGPNFISEVHTDASTTPGPHGGLGRGPPAISSAAVADTPSKTLH